MVLGINILVSLPYDANRQLEWRISMGRLDRAADTQAVSLLEGPASGKTGETIEMDGGGKVFLFKCVAVRTLNCLSFAFPLLAHVCLMSHFLSSSLSVK